MPPKAVNLVAPPVNAPVQDTLGINPEYMLPHQREAYWRHLATMNDLQSRKAKEPNNPQLDAQIAEARNQLNQLAAQAAQHEQDYRTPESFAQFTAQYQQHQQQLRQQRAPAIVATGPEGGTLDAVR